MRNAAPGRLNELATPRTTALLVIDMQRDFCDPQLARRDIAMTLEMMPRLRSLIGCARSAGVHIVHIRTEHAPDTNSDVFLLGPRWGGEPGTPLCQPGTPGAEFADGFEPAPTDTVVTKHRYSGFIGTNLQLILRSLGIRTIVATGVQTNNCVDATARDGMMLDHYLIFVADATGTYDRALHDATLVTIATHYGEVVTAADLTRIWNGQDSAMPVQAGGAAA